MKDLDKNNSPEIYLQFLSEIVNMVHTHRVHAVQSVQRISNQLYWNIGELIIQRQKEYGWGKSIVERLSKDLPHHLGDAVSWSPRNLWFMRQLVSEYSILKQVDSHLDNSSENISNLNQADSDLEKVKKLIADVPWQHNILIIQKVKDPKARIFYLQSTIKNRYSRAVLLHQIKADAYRNFIENPSQHNFATALPEHLL